MNTSRLIRKGRSIELRSGGGCMSLFGLPFLAAGLFILQIPLGIIPVGNSEEVPAWVILIFGFVFTSVSVGLVFGRKGVIIDPRSGQARAWKGLLVPMKWELRRLDQFTRVSLSKIAGDSDSSDSFPVRLAGPASIGPLDLCAPLEFGEARRHAEEIARFLDLPLEDSTTGAAVTIPPGRLGETLRERLRRDPDSIGVAPRPPGLKTAVSEQNGELTLVIPEQINRASRKFHIGCTAVTIIIMSVIVIPFLLNLPGPRSIIQAFAGFIALLFLVLPVLDLVQRLRREGKKKTIVTVSNWRLRVEERLGKRSSVTEFPADDIIELAAPTFRDKLKRLDYPGKARTQDHASSSPSIAKKLAVFGPYQSEGIIALTLKSSLAFGAGLSEDELQYLRALILKALAF